MNIPAKFEKEFAAFPLVLRNLVLAEIAAGNSIVEIGAGFPAPERRRTEFLRRQFIQQLRRVHGCVAILLRARTGELTGA